MLSIYFHPDAFNEFIHCIEWYNKQEEDLGKLFANEIIKGIELIQRFPETWSIYYKQTRRFIIKRFPYSIVYQHTKSKIIIIALIHHKQKPFFWKTRL